MQEKHAREALRIAFTFDDGPHPVNTRHLLKLAAKFDARWTFFVVGNRVANHRLIIQQQICDGHEIGNHSWSHADLASSDESVLRTELQKTEDVLIDATGKKPRLFRPPYGRITAAQRKWIKHTFNYKTVLWTIDSRDWQLRDARAIRDVVLAGARDRSVVLAHDIQSCTASAMAAILPVLQSAGFKFVTFSELGSS